MIGVAMGINNLLEIFNEKYYDGLEGGAASWSRSGASSGTRSSCTFIR